MVLWRCSKLTCLSCLLIKYIHRVKYRTWFSIMWLLNWIWRMWCITRSQLYCTLSAFSKNKLCHLVSCQVNSALQYFHFKLFKTHVAQTYSVWLCDSSVAFTYTVFTYCHSDFSLVAFVVVCDLEVFPQSSCSSHLIETHPPSWH